MKKKVLATLLAAVMAVGTMCMGVSAEEETADALDIGADVGEITFIMALRDEFLSELESGAQEAAENFGIKVTTQDAKNDTSTMLQYVETAKNAGQKVVIVNMPDPETAPQVVEAAGDMKVVFVNRLPADTSVLNENVAYVGSDEHDSGRYQGEFLAEYFKGQDKNEIKYILLNGTLGQTSTTLRTESVLKALEDNGITAEEASAPLACDYDRATAQDMIAPLLTAQTEFDCIISNNDAMAIGAIEALKMVDMDPASIPIVGIDATVDGRQAVKDGTLAMTVFQNAYGQGAGALQAAVNLVEGNGLADNTEFETDETGFILWVPFEPVTADNVADYD